MSSGFMRGLVIFFLFMITIAINVEDNVMARLGFNHDYLLMTLISMVVASLLVYRRIALIALVLFLSVAANSPADFLLNFGLDRDVITGTLFAIIVAPLAEKIFS